MATFEDLLNDARLYLNQFSEAGGMYTNTVLFPYSKLAWDELAVVLSECNFPFLKTISDDIEVDIADDSIAGPINMVYPIKMQEKPRDAEDTSYCGIDQKDWEGSEFIPVENITRWAWREQKFFFSPHTTDRDVRIFYLATLATIGDEDNVIGITHAKTVLAKRTASLAAIYSGHNPTLGDRLASEAQTFMNKLKNIQIKTQQSMPHQRRRYSARRGRGIYGFGLR